LELPESISLHLTAEYFEIKYDNIQKFCFFSIKIKRKAAPTYSFNLFDLNSIIALEIKDKISP
jgi:hypothetical protein